jgi:cytochrome c1
MRGQAVITRAACGSCHEIPGILEVRGEAGPPLAHFSKRTVIAGMLPNSPDNLAYWLRFPQRVVPGNSMPNSGLTESEARDAAAYLESLK